MREYSALDIAPGPLKISKRRRRENDDGISVCRCSWLVAQTSLMEEEEKRARRGVCWMAAKV